ncbi:cohesin domain-containing protein [Patescibacteria group bacterium]
MIRRAIIIASLIILVIPLFPRPALAAGSMFLAPNSGNFSPGSTITMSVVIGTGGQAINSAQATIAYSDDTLDLLSVSRGGSIFTLWPVEPSGGGGQITFAGGLPTPGYNGNGGLIISATFRAAALGTATARVTSGQLLLNDGSGTNILTGFGAATWSITETPEPPPPTEVIERLPAPEVSSETHPNQDTWYNEELIKLKWNKLEGALDFSYVYDDQEGTTPDDNPEGSDSSIEIKDTSDGIAYFHIKVRNEGGWSDTAHFRVKIDTTPPKKFTIRLEGENPTGILRPYIHFRTTDAHSGIKTYQVYIDGNKGTTVKSGKTTPYRLSELSLGEHEIQVEATDNAENSRSAKLMITVVDRGDDGGVQYITKYVGEGSIFRQFVFWLMWILLLLLLIIIMFFILWKRKKKKEDDEKYRGIPSNYSQPKS